MHVLLFATIFLIFRGAKGAFTVEYYENLISGNIANATTYVLPETNQEFEAGAASTEIYDVGSFDFIIIGAGSAGSVLATRLSEIGDWNILLLEAGGEENDYNAIPALFMYLQFTEMNWGYYSTPQTTCCLGMRDQRCMAPRGKSIGGSSAINAVMYVRGNPEDYDKWVDLGNPGWSYEEVLPYFIKSENSQVDGDPNYHGRGSMWNVEYALPPTDTYYTFIDGNQELNLSNIDYNGRQQIGASKTQFNIKHGKRQSTGTAFLDNARYRTNLKVITKALVTKINIDEKKVAQGVEFVANDRKFRANATKEVIVSAGAINSPQLLMLSGIGPQDHLEELDIEVIADLPVGENLMEHPLFPGLSFHTNYTYPATTIEQIIEQYLDGMGPLANPFAVDAIGFIHAGTDTEKAPLLEYLLQPPTYLNSLAPIVNRAFNWDDDLTNNYLTTINSSTDVGIYLVLLHEKSRGRVTLKSKDPIDFPNIDLNMFAEQEDLDNLIEGINFILKLVETEAFQKIDAALVDIPICADYDKYSTSFWECAIRHMSQTLYHPCGTTVMGSDNTTSVVDTNLKVHGIEKLRVVDAGVFPSTISGHTNAPTIMVAEKIADVIKSDYNVL